MSAFENAKQFLDACDNAAGWNGCKEFVADGATFSSQAEPLVGINTVEAYTEWAKGFGTVTAPGATYTLNAGGYDESTNTAVFFCTFHATHTGEGGPVDPTGRTTITHYVYALTMNDDGKVASMIKVWNAPWAMAELGWA